MAEAIVNEKAKIFDLDLRAYFDNMQHYLVPEKVAMRVQDDARMRLLKMKRPHLKVPTSLIHIAFASLGVLAVIFLGGPICQVGRPHRIPK